ncbi:MAG: MBL fold metallo-hydrolase [Chitinivibrionales bacterium]|nr:MBL fold metallo-hydrolase [Chitinivibrionales bacterium]
MKVTLAGGGGSIGASCMVVESGDSSIVIDCGIRPAGGGSALPDLSILTGKTPLAVLLTHAHMDHTGAIPVLADYFQQLPIFATPPTLELVSILLNDSLKLMKNADREAEIPLYTQLQVEKTIERFIPINHGETRTIGPFSVTLYPAGHILGASMIHLSTPHGHVLVTGDYSVTPQLTVGTVQRPAIPVDLLVSESTYGDRLHEDRAVAQERLLTMIREVLTSGGRVLIPCFAIGRAQEILLILQKAMRNGRLNKVPVYVDGLVKAVCSIYSKHERYVTRTLSHAIRTQAHPFFTDPIIAVETPGQRAAALSAGPSVVIASSGMLCGGASVVYAREFLKNERDAVFLTGYQDEESPGSALIKLSQNCDTVKKFSLSGEEIDVAASVKLFSLSAHADRLQMAGLIESIRPRTVLLVHGDRAAQQSLKQSLSCTDCICGSDGLVLERTYRVRSMPVTTLQFCLPQENDEDRIRAILGPPGHHPISGRAVAESWFGKKVPAVLVEQFIDRIVNLELVARDDQRRSFVWVLPPSRSDRLAGQACFESELKAANPKGRLLEHCMRTKTPFPSVQRGVQGAYHTARMTVTIDGKEFDSGIHRGSDEICAEQSAARHILTLCEQDDRAALAGAVIAVDEEAAIELKRNNPKGRLLERFRREKEASCNFETRDVAGCWHCRISWIIAAAAAQSDWYRAPSRVTAEQAAASSVLSRLESENSSTGTESQPVTVVASPVPETGDGKDPRVALNELRQRQFIADFGYEYVAASNPVQPAVFHVKAWALYDDTIRLVSDVKQGKSKREAERLAARDLVIKIGAFLENGGPGAGELEP